MQGLQGHIVWSDSVPGAAPMAAILSCSETQLTVRLSFNCQWLTNSSQSAWCFESKTLQPGKPEALLAGSVHGKSTSLRCAGADSGTGHMCYVIMCFGSSAGAQAEAAARYRERVVRPAAAADSCCCALSPARCMAARGLHLNIVHKRSHQGTLCAA